MKKEKKYTFLLIGQKHRKIEHFFHLLDEKTPAFQFSIMHATEEGGSLHEEIQPDIVFLGGPFHDTELKRTLKDCMHRFGTCPLVLLKDTNLNNSDLSIPTCSDSLVLDLNRPDESVQQLIDFLNTNPSIPFQETKALWESQNLFHGQVPYENPTHTLMTKVIPWLRDKIPFHHFLLLSEYEHDFSLVPLWPENFSKYKSFAEDELKSLRSWYRIVKNAFSSYSLSRQTQPKCVYIDDVNAWYPPIFEGMPAFSEIHALLFIPLTFEPNHFEALLFTFPAGEKPAFKDIEFLYWFVKAVHPHVLSMNPGSLTIFHRSCEHDFMNYPLEDIQYLLHLDERMMCSHTLKDLFRTLFEDLSQVFPLDCGVVILHHCDQTDAFVIPLRPIEKTLIDRIIQCSHTECHIADIIFKDGEHLIYNILSPPYKGTEPVKELNSTAQFLMKKRGKHSFTGCIFLASEKQNAYPSYIHRFLNTVFHHVLDSIHRIYMQKEYEKKWLHELMETLPVGIIIVDAQDSILLANTPARVWLRKIENPDIPTKNSRHEIPFLKGIIREALSTGQCEISLLENLPHTYSILAREMKNELHKGEIILVIRDVTTEREIMQRAYALERRALIGKLVYDITHAFKNKLVPMIHLGSKYSEDQSLPDHVREAFQLIHDEAKKANSIFRNLIAYGERTDFEKTPLDLKEFVEDFVLRTMATVFEHSIQIQFEDDGHTDYPILGDPHQIEDIIMNLLTNAIDAMEQKGTITFRLARKKFTEDETLPFKQMKGKEWVILECEDTGQGIPSEVLPHIFEPFYTTKPKGEGTGLGLSAVYGHVKQHGGYILVKSTPGEGTVFILYFPSLFNFTTDSPS